MEQAKKENLGGIKETLKRIEVLTAMQLKNITKKTLIGKGRKALSYVLASIGFIGITAIMFLFLYVMTLLFQASFLVNYRFLIAYLLIMQVTSIVTCTGGMMQTLFLDQDNAILLAFPCRHSEVFLSKLAVYYVSEFKKSLFAILPMIVAFGLFQKNSLLAELHIIIPLYYFWALISAFTLPLIPVLFGAILSLPCAFLKRFIKQNTFVEAAFYVLLFAFIYYFIYYLTTKLPAKIEVITKYIIFIEKVQNIVYKISDFGLYTRFYVFLFFSKDTLINFLYLFGIIVFGLALTTLITMPFYFKIASHSMEESVEMKHKEVNHAHKGIFNSFLRKDIIITSRGLGGLINENILLFLMPPIIIFTLSIYSRMVLDESLSPFLINIFIMVFILILSLSNNDIAASAITREGSEFVLVKTAPNQTSVIAWSKIVINLITSFLFTTLAFALLFLGLRLTKLNYLLENATIIGHFQLPRILIIYFVTVVLNAGIIFHAVELDIRNPHLQEYASTGSIKENKNVSTTESYSFILTVLMVLIYGLSYMAFPSILYLLVLVVSIFYFLFRFFMFKANLYAFFDEIEL